MAKILRKMETTARRREEGEEDQTPKKPKIIEQHQEVDRISELPDDILHPILSLLTLKEACITSSLSKRWRDLFPSLPRLDLSPPVDIDMKRWLETVRSMLESRRAPVRICTILAEIISYRQDFDNIICSLCYNGIQELTIENDGKYKWKYIVPSSLYFCRTLTHIELTKCMLKVPIKFCLLRRLKALKIVECMVEDGDLQRLIFGCPAVERLTVENCDGLRNLVVDAPKLAVLDVTADGTLQVSIVNAPRLDSVTVNLRFCYDSDEDDGSGTDDDDDGTVADESEGTRLVTLLESLGDPRDLAIEFRNLDGKILTEGAVVPVTLPSLLPKLKQLTLKMPLGSTFVLSILSCLLNSCPNLDHLIIIDNYLHVPNTCPNPEASVLNYWDHQVPSDCMRNTLSSVILSVGCGYRWKYLIKLAKFLLNNARVLKHLAIRFYEEEISKMVEDLQREMLLLSPASPDAVVLFMAARSSIVYRPARLTYYQGRI